MGKRSQAKGKWLTASQREARGKAKSGARLWYLKKDDKGQATPGTPKGRDDATH